MLGVIPQEFPLQDFQSLTGMLQLGEGFSWVVTVHLGLCRSKLLSMLHWHYIWQCCGKVVLPFFWLLWKFQWFELPCCLHLGWISFLKYVRCTADLHAPIWRVSSFCPCNLSNISSLTNLQLRWALLTEKPQWNQSRDSLQFYFVKFGFLVVYVWVFFNQNKWNWIHAVSVPAQREYFNECRQSESNG